MKFSLEGIFIAILMGLVAALAVQSAIYRGNAIDYKAQRDKATDALKLANATIDDMTVRQREVFALDAKYAKELYDATTKNDRLRAKLAAGSRVRVAGECKASTGSVGNAGTIELSPNAGSNVLDIRAGIIRDQTKVRYLQQYIREQCLK